MKNKKNKKKMKNAVQMKNEERRLVYIWKKRFFLKPQIF